MTRVWYLGLVAALVVQVPLPAAADGDAARGKRAFLQCVMCHSAEPGVHKSGPSLAGIWGREAGTVEGFGRYSDALRKADLVWSAETLDAWLRDPQSVVPGTSMRVQGIASAEERRNIIAYLKQLAAGGDAAGAPSSGGEMTEASEAADPTAAPPATHGITATAFFRTAKPGIKSPLAPEARR